MKISRVRAMEILKSTIQEVFPLYNLAKLRGKSGNALRELKRKKGKFKKIIHYGNRSRQSKI